jgi:hypothetical protein
MERRIIRIGHRTIIGVVCPHCVQKTIIYPESAFHDHMRLHHQPVIYSRKPHYAPHSHGRPPGIHSPVMGAMRTFREGIKAR